LYTDVRSYKFQGVTLIRNNIHENKKLLPKDNNQLIKVFVLVPLKLSFFRIRFWDDVSKKNSAKFSYTNTQPLLDISQDY